MEYYWNLLNNSGSRGDGVGGHDSNSCGNPAWESWDLAGNNFHAPSTSAGLQVEAVGFHALMLRQDHEENAELHFRSVSSSFYSGKGPCYHNPDPHLTFMKLGKRQYLPGSSAGPSYTGKRGKFCDPSWEKTSGPAVAVPAVVPRCQVESCGTLLANVKDYHRRHKVCEKHAKAPKVLVLGIEQRFCQQCSRFHTVNEFDESKRSCRRRLAGHNERRRKSSQEHSLAKRSVQDLHTRRSAALRELIAENRASILACSKNNPNFNNDQMENFWIQNGSTLRFLNGSSQQTGGQLTLDLMQASSSEFGMFSMHDYDEGNKTKLFKAVNYQQECSEF